MLANTPGVDCASGLFPVLGGGRSGGALRRLAVPCPFLPRGQPAAVPHVRQRPPGVQAEQDGGLPGLQQLPRLLRPPPALLWQVHHRPQTVYSFLSGTSAAAVCR
jgi:hypothetical protein